MFSEIWFLDRGHSRQLGQLEMLLWARVTWRKGATQRQSGSQNTCFVEAGGKLAGIEIRVFVYLVLHHCETDQHTFSGFRQHTLITSRFRRPGPSAQSAIVLLGSLGSTPGLLAAGRIHALVVPISRLFLAGNDS